MRFLRPVLLHRNPSFESPAAFIAQMCRHFDDDDLATVPCHDCGAFALTDPPIYQPLPGFAPDDLPSGLSLAAMNNAKASPESVSKALRLRR